MANRTAQITANQKKTLPGGRVQWSWPHLEALNSEVTRT